MMFSWNDTFTPLTDVWHGVANFVPTLLVAIIIAIIGWIVGAVFYKVVSELIKLSKLDSALRAAGVERIVERAGFKLNAGVFFGKLVEWFFIIVFLADSFNVLGLTQVTSFLKDVVLGYLPQVIVAALIILVAAIVAETVQKLVTGSAKAANMRSAHFAGTITKWAVWIFAILVAIAQLGIAAGFIQTLFTGVIIALSLALGLSFGLGGQSAAASYIEKVRGEIKDR